MKRSVFAILVLVVGMVWWSFQPPPRARIAKASAAGVVGAAEAGHLTSKGAQTSSLDPLLRLASKDDRIAAIERDYDEMRAKISADFAVITAESPNGLAVFLRQLTMIEREKRSDLAAVLTASELEEYELTRSPAGQVVAELLNDTSASDAQRRAVFQLQRAFAEQFGLALDFAPASNLAREQARYRTQEKIRDVLGDNLFAGWLRGEGSEFEEIRQFVADCHLPSATALELWRIKNELTLRRLEMTAQPDLSLANARELHAKLMRDIRSRVLNEIGLSPLQAGNIDSLRWLRDGSLRRGSP
ncbi:MAG: hypothetical protein ABIV50_10525 [Opitutus sp.]